MITGEQVRLLRAALDLTQAEFGKLLGVQRGTVNNIEKSHHKADSKNFDKIEVLCKSSGYEFISGGIQKRQPQILQLSGSHGFCEFMDDVYYTTQAQGGELCVCNVDESNWIKWMGQDGYNAHATRMAKLDNFKFRILVKEGDSNFIATDIAKYRWVKEEQFSGDSFYAYGDKLAILSFLEDDVHILIIEQPKAARAFVTLFNVIWDSAERGGA